MEEENNRNSNNSSIKILVIIFVAIFVIVTISRYVTDEEYRSYLNVHLFKNEIEEASGSIIEVNSDMNPYIFAYDKYVAVLSKNKLVEYTADGREVANLELNISVPMVASNGKYMVVADENGHNLYLISGSNILWSTTVEGDITRVNVNQNGYVSLVISNTIYKSVIAYYDLEGVELFRTYLSTDFAICTSVSTNNKYLAIGEVDYSGTIIKSYIKIISVEKAQKDPDNSIVYTYESESGQVITNIEYQDKTHCICMFNSYIQSVGINSDERLYDISSEDLFVDIGLNRAITKIDKQSSGLFSYEYELLTKDSINSSEHLYILNSDLPKSMVASGDNIALNLGNEVDIVTSKGWLKKKYKSSNQISSIILGDSICGIVYKNRIELIEI